MFRHVLIVGMGLIGSSLAKGLKDRGVASYVVGNDISEKSLRWAKDRGIIDEKMSSFTDEARSADLVIICTPLSSYLDVSKALPRFLSPNCIITDVGSVKTCVTPNFVNYLSAELKRNFVSGHPIAGSEKSGVEGGNSTLFHGRTVVLTPMQITSSAAIKDVKSMWEGLGAKVINMAPEKHDEVYAAVSHVPQLLAFSFTDTLNKLKANVSKPDEYLEKFTRLGKSSPIIWRDIFFFNQKNISRVLSEFYLNLNSFSLAIKDKKREAIAARLNEACRKAGNKYGETSLTKDKKNLIQIVLPRILAAMLIESVKPDHHIDFKGPGFTDFTACLPTKLDYTASLIVEMADEVYKDLSIFHQCFDTYYKLIERNTRPDILDKLTESRKSFDKIFPPKKS